MKYRNLTALRCYATSPLLPQRVYSYKEVAIESLPNIVNCNIVRFTWSMTLWPNRVVRRVLLSQWTTKRSECRNWFCRLLFFFFFFPFSFTVTIAMWLQDIWLLHRELMLRTKEQCSLKGLLMGHSSAVYSLKITICQHLLTARTTSQALFIVLRRCFSGPVPRAG